MKGYDCERCGDGQTQITTLIGDHTARLCARCIDDWSGLIKSEPLWEELNDIEEEYSVRQMEIAFKGDFDARRELLKSIRLRSRELRRQFYDKARLFVLKCNAPTAEGAQPSPPR